MRRPADCLVEGAVLEGAQVAVDRGLGRGDLTREAVSRNTTRLGVRLLPPYLWHQVGPVGSTFAALGCASAVQMIEDVRDQHARMPADAVAA